MGNRTDLKNLAAEMEVLSTHDKGIWLNKISHCRESYIQSDRHFEQEQNILITTLTRKLAGEFQVQKVMESIENVVKKGCNAFISASEEERKVFCTLVDKETSCQ